MIGVIVGSIIVVLLLTLVIGISISIFTLIFIITTLFSYIIRTSDYMLFKKKK